MATELAGRCRGRWSALRTHGAWTSDQSPLVFLLYHETAFQDLLHRNGIPVPHAYGWLDELPAYVMDRVRGRPDFADSAVAERDAVMAEYMRILTDIHALDVDEFEAAGITRSASPSTPSSVGMAYFGKLYRQTKRRWDSAQFHHRDGKIAALLDLEIGHIGDPMMDLAAFRMRDTLLNFGDFDELYGIYADATAVDLDMAAI
jgi:aminoglycoside phosphotransferase (APT) family kinase protein